MLNKIITVLQMWNKWFMLHKITVILCFVIIVVYIYIYIYTYVHKTNISVLNDSVSLYQSIGWNFI